MKTESSSPSCADRLKVLADTTRLAVLESLMEKPKHVNELMDLLDIEQSLLSHHLAQLRAAGLVEASRDGKAVLYQLASGVATATTGRSLDLGCCHLSFPIQPQQTKRR